MLIKQMCSRLGWLVLLLQLIGSNLVGKAQAQAVGCLPLPTDPLCFAAGQPLVTAPQYLDITISGAVGTGLAVQNGIYPGFCVDKIGGIIPGPTVFCGITLRYLTDPNIGSYAYIPAKILNNASAINWILNHRGATPGPEVIEAIWHFTDGSSDYLAYPNAVALVNGAIANPGYVPQPGERQAVLLDGGAAWNDPYPPYTFGGYTYSRQWIILEVTCPLPPLSCSIAPQTAQTVCSGGSATFTATGVDGSPTYTYLWSGPGGFSSTSDKITVSAPGTYTVVVSDSKNQTSTCSAVLTVLPPLTVSVNDAAVCAGYSAMLTATPSDPDVTYLWSNGETTPSITVTPSASSPYTVQVFKGGCKGSGIGNVTVNPLPTVSLENTSVCVGGTVTLTPVVTGNPTSFVWTVNGSIVSTDPTLTVTPDATTTYTITVATATYCSDDASATVTLKPLPTASVKSTVICLGDSATLTVTTDAGAGATYLWNTGATTPSITVKPTVDTDYSVIVTSVTGCSVEAKASVDIGNCICVVQADPDSRCTTTAGHAIYLPGIGTDFVFPTPAKFIDNLDGTARLVGTAVSKSDATKMWLVDLLFTGYTKVAPAGSPKKELSSSAYKPYGPIDPTTWGYYTDFTGTLTGQGKYAGAILTINDYMAAFQIGVGANGKNTHFGASGWFTVTVTHQPTTGAAISCTTHGDINIDLVDCNPQTPVTGNITGKVVCSDNNSPLSGVLVTLKNSNGSVVATKTTDASGNYKFDNLAPGSYTVSVPSTSGGLAVSGSSSTPVTIIGTGTGTANFAYKGGLISGYVYCDANGNCIKDTGDDVL